MLEKILGKLPTHIAAAFFVGLTAGAFLGQYAFVWADSFFFKDRASAAQQELASEQTKRREAEQEVARMTKAMQSMVSAEDMKSATAEIAHLSQANETLTSELNRLKAPYDQRINFINFIKEGVVRPCDQEFVLFNMKFSPRPSTHDDEDVAMYTSSTRIGLKYGSPKIEIINSTYVKIELTDASKACQVRFSIPQ